MATLIKILCLICGIIDMIVFITTKDLYWGIMAIIMFEAYKLND